MPIICNPTLEMLAQAETAYHALQLGQSARVVVDQNGERVEFTAANRADLAKYIQDLKMGLGLLSPCQVPPPGPVGFVF